MQLHRILADTTPFILFLLLFSLYACEKKPSSSLFKSTEFQITANQAIDSINYEIDKIPGFFLDSIGIGSNIYMVLPMM